ncbi:MAG: hypothetical protein K9J84_14385 [Bacteroidia bacterium]|jgi:hypothetical protein|nr:hypothetical protein [Bacteroidia bacterium]
MEKIQITTFNELYDFVSRDEVSIYEMKRLVKATLNAYIIEERKDVALKDIKIWWAQFKDQVERPPIIFYPNESILSKSK